MGFTRASLSGSGWRIIRFPPAQCLKARCPVNTIATWGRASLQA